MIKNRIFSGFAGDKEFQLETNRLKSILRMRKADFVENQCMCVAYDAPFKIFGRRNEVMVMATNNDQLGQPSMLSKYYSIKPAMNYFNFNFGF